MERLWNMPNAPWSWLQKDALPPRLRVSRRVRGNLDAALEAAQKAETLSPALARTQTVLGFAYLTRIEVE